MTIPENVLQRAQNIKLFAMDVDGVMTNGEIIYSDDGREFKIFNVKDGHGIAMLLRATAIDVAIITGRQSTITERRAQELGIRYLYQHVKNKLPVLETLADQLNLSLSEIAYMGDDTPDIPILESVGLAVCPSDAVDDVKRICHYTTESLGGRGAVREITDLLLQIHAPSPFAQSVAQKAPQA